MNFFKKIFFAGMVFSVWFFLFAPLAHATTNISNASGEYWGWNDVVGWIRFNTASDGLSVTVTNTKIQGYATSTSGDVSLDCGTTSIGDICAGAVDYKVSNDGSGNLSGYAWNDVYGWISFDCHNTNGCSTSSYQVTIDSNGNFQGYAWNDVIGWISFNCANTTSCATSDYKVKTSWVPTATTGTLTSVVFDTGVTHGAALYSITWQGTKPTGTHVRFQLATSNDSAGPWNFIGPDGTSDTYYPQDTTLGPSDIIPLAYNLHNDYRYFRYRVTLFSDSISSVAPTVTSISVHWGH